LNLQGKKILVTGADGFIGSHLTEALVKLGATVRAFVYYNSFGHLGWLEHIEKDVLEQLEIHNGDIRNYDSVRTAVKDCEIVLHLAALIGIPYSYLSPDSYVDTNIKGTVNILQACRELNVEKVVHTSTSEVYGSALYVPIDEIHPLQAQSPYSASKISADQMALSFFKSFDLPVAIIRPFNTYGPRQSSRAVIPTIISQIANGKREIQIGALKPTRDFNYIEDTVRGFIAVANSEKSIGEVINIGSGYEISIENLIYQIATLMDTEVSLISDAERLRPANSEVERLLADNRKAKSMLDWTPHYSSIEGLKRGLRYTINWFANPENLIRYRPDQYGV